MTTPANRQPGAPGAPPPQHNLQTATDKAVEQLRAQSPEQLIWLGAARNGDLWRLGVLEDTLDVDIRAGCVSTGEGQVRPEWRLLVLHYLAITTKPATCPPEVTFAALPNARTYASVYEGRVIRRLCATAGRDAQTLAGAAAKLGARQANGGDLSFDFDVFGRLSVRLVWYAGDDEFGPSASLLLPGNIESILCVEDIVVLSEGIVSRLSGQPF